MRLLEQALEFLRADGSSPLAGSRLRIATEFEACKNFAYGGGGSAGSAHTGVEKIDLANLDLPDVAGRSISLRSFVTGNAPSTSTLVV